MAKEDSKQSLYDIIKDKVFFSRFNDEMAIVVEKFPDVCEDGKVYFNGMTLVDGIEDCEDDIQQVYSITREGKKVNLEDYYSANGAYSETGEERFMEALDNLMTREEYEQYHAKLIASTEILVKTFFNGETENCTIQDNGTVDVAGNVLVDASKLIDGHLPFKFGKVDGDFVAENCGLTSLSGCPDEVTGDFRVSYNKIDSLAGCPCKVGGDFVCSHNQLLSLDGVPVEVGGGFKFSDTTIYNLLKNMAIFSRNNDEMVIFVEEFPSELEVGKVYFNGVTLVNCVEDCKDDCQQVFGMIKKKKKIFLAYPRDGRMCYTNALDELMTREEYEQYQAWRNAPLEYRIKTFFEGQNTGKDQWDWKPGLIESYTINEDGTVDVVGDVFVDVSDLIDGHLPIKFGKVDGNFEAEDCGLTSLWGCPDEVTGYFSVGYNGISSLEGCPSKVGDGFFCEDNILTSLEGCPQKVGGDFVCSHNLLTSLAGAPAEVGGNFECYDNHSLENLDGVPAKIGGVLIDYDPEFDYDEDDYDEDDCE